MVPGDTAAIPFVPSVPFVRVVVGRGSGVVLVVVPGTVAGVGERTGLGLDNDGNEDVLGKLDNEDKRILEGRELVPPVMVFVLLVLFVPVPGDIVKELDEDDDVKFPHRKDINVVVWGIDERR